MGNHLGEFKGRGFKDSVNAFFFFFVSELSFCKFFILMLSLLVCFLFLKQIKSFLSISTGKNTCTRQLSGQASIYIIHYITYRNFHTSLISYHWLNL